MRKLAAGLFAMALAITGVACGEEGGGGGGDSVDALALAADKATEAGTATMTMTMEMSAAGQTVSVDAEGELDFANELAEMTMTMAVPGTPGEQTIKMVMEGNYIYMELPPELGGTGDWVRMDASAIPGAATNPQMSQDPSQYLEFLRGASEDGLEEVGTEKIDGDETTHYKAELSFEKILDQAPDEEAADEIRAQLEQFGGEVDSIPADVWIDEEGLPRQMKLDMSMEAQGQSIEMLITMGFSDYGAEVDIEPPADYEEIEAPTG
ncbi:MAG TPA: DUF6612 family protein [Actinomycetota bacterium]|nr:DUF6612 family protein [Actinomycetota bacterium]